MLHHGRKSIGMSTLPKESSLKAYSFAQFYDRFSVLADKRSFLAKNPRTRPSDLFSLPKS